MNTHAVFLEKALTAKGLVVEKESSRLWRIAGVRGVVTYNPTAGSCHRFDKALGARKREQLRGSPDRVAEILEGFVR